VRYLWESGEAAGARHVPRRARARRGRAARVPRRLCAERLGQGARRLAPRRLQRPRAGRRGPGRPRRQGPGPHLRPLPPADHVPAVRRPRARARLRRAGDGRRPEAEVPELLRQRGLPQGPHGVRGRHRPRGRGEGERGRRRRGLHRRHRHAPGRPAQHGRAHGHRDDRRAGGASSRASRRRCCSPRRRQRRAGGDAARGARRRGPQLALRVVPLPPARPGRPRAGRGPATPEAARAGVGAVRALPASSASWPRRT
jgi:hypothetical protein